jgi:hypothetical protein
MHDMRFLFPHTEPDGGNPEGSSAEKVERPEGADPFFCRRLFNLYFPELDGLIG